MAKLYVSEYYGFVPGETVVQEPAVAEQVVTFTGTAGASAAFGAGTRVIRVSTDSIASILVGVDPTATTSNKRLPDESVEYFAVSPGMKISAIVNT